MAAATKRAFLVKVESLVELPGFLSCGIGRNANATLLETPNQSQAISPGANGELYFILPRSCTSTAREERRISSFHIC